MVAVLILVCAVVVGAPAFVGAQSFGGSGGDNPGSVGQSPGSPDRIPNPLGTIDGQRVDDIASFVTLILKNIVLPIGVVIVVFFVIYSGFLFVTAQGNIKKIEDARKTFLWVVVGAAILLGSVVIASAIQNTVCAIAPSACSSGGIPQGGSILR